MGVGPHVEVRDLRIVYRTGPDREVTAVDDVSFAIERGGTLAIVGESGCGKSSLVRAFLAYTRPGARIAGGRLTVGNVDILTLRDGALRDYRGGQAAMVPQNPLSSLTPHMTVGAQLSELIARHRAAARGEVRDRAFQLLSEMRLPDPRAIFDRYPHQLSGGQRQRVVIAAALVGSPELIVLDEPTTALDKTVETQVLDLVAEIQKRLNTTLVYVSHDLNVVARMCERVLVMKDGKIVEDGPIRQVFTAPRTGYARSLLAAIPRLRTGPASSPRSRSDTPALLAVEGVRFAYGRRRPSSLLTGLFAPRTSPAVLSDISFDIPRGTTLGVVGESGSGKSTLANLVGGLVHGAEGSITFDGETVRGPAIRRHRELRRRIQVIFQDPLSSLNPQHSVEQIVGRPLQVFFNMTRAAIRERVLELLRELDLDPAVLGRSPRQLSGGQQQRVAIARAFACKPDLVLCDEVTSALDVTIQAQVLKLMKRLQSEHGTTYLFISHDLPVVAEMADQILVLEKGSVRDFGDTASVLASPRSDYTRQLLDAYRASSVQIAQRTLRHVG